MPPFSQVAPLNLLEETCLWDRMWEHIVQTDKHLAGWLFLVNITERDKTKSQQIPTKHRNSVIACEKKNCFCSAGAKKRCGHTSA